MLAYGIPGEGTSLSGVKATFFVGRVKCFLMRTVIAFAWEVSVFLQGQISCYHSQQYQLSSSRHLNTSQPTESKDRVFLHLFICSLLFAKKGIFSRKFCSCLPALAYGLLALRFPNESRESVSRPSFEKCSSTHFSSW